MTLPAKRVLVTGINGFTGCYVEQEFQKHGWEVFGLVQHPELGRTNCYTANLLEPDSIQRAVREIRPTAVVHLAGIAFVAHGDVKAIYETNLLGTRNLLQALSESPQIPQKVLVASSANIYGNAKSGQITEETPMDPANDYAVSKVAMEYLAKLYASKMNLILARPFNYTGVGQSPMFLIPKIVEHFREQRESIELGNLDVARDFSDVRFVATAYRKLIESVNETLAVNVCSGTHYSLSQVLELAEQISGHRMQVKVNPAFVRANEVKILWGSSEKLHSLVGTIPRPSLRETLAWMLG